MQARRPDQNRVSRDCAGARRAACRLRGGIRSTALSFGTTAQWWVSNSIALQGTVLGGLGYGAAGPIHNTGERDYHYGATPQALAALRLIFGESANLDLMMRSYYVSEVASTETSGSERIFRGDLAFTVP